MKHNKNDATSQSDAKIQWHPAFCAAAEIELRSNKDALEFHAEYNLSQKPLQIDLLVIEKKKDVPISNEIGHIFRKHNIIEYKSPDDGLSIDDFFKTVGYAYLYKGLGETVNEIPLHELTVSLFREAKPQKLMKNIKDCGCEIQKYTDGIYYVHGLLIPAQIIVMKELTTKLHSTLKVLSRKVKKEDIQNFLNQVDNFTEPGEKKKADAIIQVSVTANMQIYNEVRGQNDMCEALRELMKEEIAEEMEKAQKEGLMKGLIEGRTKGRMEGRMEGENRMSMLYKTLLQNGRQDDIPRMMEDAEYREQLFKEYSIE